MTVPNLVEILHHRGMHAWHVMVMYPLIGHHDNFNNAACIVLATPTFNFQVRTKHLDIKWYHLRDQVALLARDQVTNEYLQIIKVHTGQNLADIFMKHLVKKKFQCLNKLLLG